MKQEPPALADASIFGKAPQEEECTGLSNTHSGRTANGSQHGVPICILQYPPALQAPLTQVEHQGTSQISKHWIVMGMTELASDPGLGLACGYAQLSTCVSHIFCISALDCCRPYSCLPVPEGVLQESWRGTGSDLVDFKVVMLLFEPMPEDA